MTRQWKLKLLAYFWGLSLILMGLSELQQGTAAPLPSEPAANAAMEEGAVALLGGVSPVLHSGHVLIVAGGLIWLLIGLWMGTDIAAERWRQKRVAEFPGAEVFQGRSAEVLWSLPGGAMTLIALGVWVESAVHRQSFSFAAAAAFVLGAAIFTSGLWRSRAVVVLSPETVALVTLRGRTVWSLAEVVTLGIEEPSPSRGLLACTYTLHADPAAGKKSLRIGSHLFRGGLEKPMAFGTSLRTYLVERLAPPLAARLHAGELVEFGPVIASLEGIAKSRKKAVAGEVLPWGEIDSARTDKLGYLRIKRKGKALPWGVYPAKKILNRDVLIRFMERGRP